MNDKKLQELKEKLSNGIPLLMDGCVTCLKADIDKLIAEIERLRELNRWIPFNERLPDESGYYLIQQDCCGITNYMRVARYNSEIQKFRSAEVYCYYEKIIAWRKLPESYKEI